MSLPARGKGNPPVPLNFDSIVIKLPSCPDCKGQGYFLINPFATGGPNGCGGLKNATQCLTCFHAHEYWQQHGELPAELVQQEGGAT